jgi:hypothetical protein
MMSDVESEEVASRVDAFVEKVNAQRHERMLLKDVPSFLRNPSPDDEGDDGISTDWRIAKVDNAAAIATLEVKIGMAFPPSFRRLIARYCFPARSVSVTGFAEGRMLRTSRTPFDAVGD